MAVAFRNRDRERIAQLHAAVATVRQAIDDDQSVAAKSRELAAVRHELLDTLAEQEARGEISREAVDEKLTEADRESAAHTRNAEARDRAAEVRARELAALEAELAQLSVATKLAEFAGVVKKQDAATAAAKRAITEAAKAATALDEARQRTAQLEAELRRELGDVDVTWPDGPDDLELDAGRINVRLIAGNDLVGGTVRGGETVLLVALPHSPGLVNRVSFDGDLRSLLDLLAG